MIIVSQENFSTIFVRKYIKTHIYKKKICRHLSNDTSLQRGEEWQKTQYENG